MRLALLFLFLCLVLVLVEGGKYKKKKHNYSKQRSVGRKNNYVKKQPDKKRKYSPSNKGKVSYGKKPSPIQPMRKQSAEIKPKTNSKIKPKKNIAKKGYKQNKKYKKSAGKKSYAKKSKEKKSYKSKSKEKKSYKNKSKEKKKHKKPPRKYIVQKPKKKTKDKMLEDEPNNILKRQPSKYDNKTKKNKRQLSKSKTKKEKKTKRKGRFLEKKVKNKGDKKKKKPSKKNTKRKLKKNKKKEKRNIKRKLRQKNKKPKQIRKQIERKRNQKKQKKNVILKRIQKKKPKVKKNRTKKEKYIGCYLDKRRRMLPKAKLSSSKMTVEKCLQFCATKRTKFAGLQYKHQCFCGNKILKTRKKKEKDCNMVCKGNKKQKCGGSWRLSVYKVNSEPGLECHKLAKVRNGKCVCKRGYLGDGKKSCSKACTCMASGDPHYKTYDGQMIHFMGTCKYILTKSMTTDKCAFSVEVKNEHRGRNKRVSFTRMVDVKIYGKTVRITQGGNVLINGEKKFLPVEENNGQLKVYRSGRYVQVWTYCGVEVNFDGRHAVFVSTPPAYRGKLEGICGDCNGKKDDLRTREGKDVSMTTNKYALVGDSYSVFDDSDDPETRCETQDVPLKCDDEMGKLVKGRDVCGDLKNVNGRFAACVKAIPQIAKDYYNSCVMDMCAYQGEVNLLHMVKCSSLESFVEECAENGVVVKWRTNSFCPLKCEDPNMEYMAMGPGCPSTCLDPNAPSTCTVEGREGCFCKEGFVLSDNKCIKLHECGCKDRNGDYYPIGSKKQTKDCSSEYTCRSVDNRATFVRTTSGRRCHRDAVCIFDDDGQRSCRCRKGYQGDGVEQCSKTPTRTTTVTPPRRVTDSISSEEPEDEVTTTLKCNHPEPECSVVVRHSSCGTETIVTGKCVYSNHFSTQCKYSVTTDIRQDGKLSAKVTIGDNKDVLMSPEDVVKNCATFSVRGAILVITEDMCERCVLEFIRNIGPRNTCS